jgi:hypothetical protein
VLGFRGGSAAWMRTIDELGEAPLDTLEARVHIVGGK